MTTSEAPPAEGRRGVTALEVLRLVGVSVWYSALLVPVFGLVSYALVVNRPGMHISWEVCGVVAVVAGTVAALVTHDRQAGLSANFDVSKETVMGWRGNRDLKRLETTIEAGWMALRLPTANGTAGAEEKLQRIGQSILERCQPLVDAGRGGEAVAAITAARRPGATPHETVWNKVLDAVGERVANE